MDSIIDAILQGDDDDLRRKLQRGVTAAVLNRAYPMQHMVQHVCTPGELLTPLALAAGWGKRSCVALLLEAGASPNASRGEGTKEHWKTIPLHWACANGQVDCAMLLLDAPGGSDTVDTKLRGGLTPLGMAALEGKLSVARLLIERGCNVNEPRESGASPLYGACQEGHAEIVRLLVAAKANIQQLRTHSGASPLFAAAGHGHPVCVEVLLSAKADMTTVAKDGMTALTIARNAVAHRRGSNPGKCVALLEEHARRLEAQPASPPIFAAALDVTDSASAPEAYPVTPTELVELVRGTQKCRLGEVLTRATGCVVTPAILDLPAGTASDPPLPDGNRIGGRTPLVAACMLKSRFDLGVVSLLLDAKASVDQRAADASQLFPLMAGLHNQACVELLLERGADVEQADGAGYTPLLAACEWGLADAVRSLLAHGADPTAKGKEAGFTPLVAASMAGKPECVLLLLQAGVDPSSSKKCFKGGTPFPVPPGGLDALAWAKKGKEYTPSRLSGGYKAVIEMLSGFDDFLETAKDLGVLTESEVGALAERIAAAPPTERHELRRRLMDEHQADMRAASGRAARADMKLLEQQRIAFEADPRAVAVEQLRPSGAAPVLGGRGRIRGLTKAPALNGEVGSIVSFNADGRRRFGVRLKTGKVLAVLPANLVAVDQGAEWPRCTAPSKEVCDTLQTAFAAVGLTKLTVVDWTPLAADPAIDAANLHEMGLFSHFAGGGSGGGGADGGDEGRGDGGSAGKVYYVQRTEATEGFFLTARELMEAPDGTMQLKMCGASTLPWLLYLGLPGSNGLLTPNGREEWCSNLAYIARFCSSSLATDITCAVCLESMSVRENPSQLPCAHFMCVRCIKKLYPVDRLGMVCPVCQRNHSTYTLVASEECPGGIVIAESAAH